MEIMLVIGLLLAFAALFTLATINASFPRQKNYRTAAAPVIKLLTSEMHLVSAGEYPFSLITEAEIYELYPYLNEKQQILLTEAYDLYTEALTSTANIRHRGEEHPSSMIDFPKGFIITNPQEVLKKMEPLRQVLAGEWGVFL
ncbi:hypothetical protein FD682_13655 [Atlantibacter subterranea]|nr:hypothetical protein [Atlantibacter subterranea]